MLCTDGRLCHIDFGFIMGRDPKPFPPPMKLCGEMIEAMGGADSEHYTRFRTYSGEAYNILRKSANLIFSLFHLMVSRRGTRTWGCERLGIVHRRRASAQQLTTVLNIAARLLMISPGWRGSARHQGRSGEGHVEAAGEASA
jgi:hypothetical protein